MCGFYGWNGPSQTTGHQQNSLGQNTGCSCKNTGWSKNQKFQKFVIFANFQHLMGGMAWPRLQNIKTIVWVRIQGELAEKTG
jgi:hypothetical protein